MLAVAVIAASVSGYVQFVSAKKNAEESLSKRLRGDMSNCIEHFAHEYSMGIERALADIESSPGLDRFLSSPAEESIIYLLDEERKFQWLAKQTPGCISISFIDRDGKEVISVSGGKRIRNLVYIFDSKEEYYKRVANLFGTLKAIPLGNVLFDKPFKSRGRMEFVAGMAKSDPEVGGFAGVIMIRMDLSMYVAYLSSKKEVDNSLLWLFDAEGGTILAPENRTVSPDPSPVIFGKIQHPKNNMILPGDVMAGQPEHIFLKLAFSASQKVFSSLTANIVKNTLVVILLALAVSSLISYFASRWFTRPIVSLAHACKGIGKGDFSGKIPAIGGMEMQELADSFNQMTENLGSMTVSRDIFQKEKDMAQNYLDITEVMLVALDCQGKVSMINRRGCEILGYPESDIIGKSWFESFLPENFKLNAEQNFSKLLRKETEHVKYVENSILSRGGEEKIIAWHNAVLSDKDGNAIGTLSSGEDITKRKRAEELLRETNRKLEAATEQAVQANAAKSDFLANMSHEIRTPMNGVIGMTGLLLDTELSYEQRKYAETLRASGESLLTIINDILDFSKIEAGKLELEIMDFDLRAILDDFAASLALQVQKKGLEFICAISPDVPPRLCGDPGRLRQVLVNIAGNAIKFTHKGEIAVLAGLVSESDVKAVIRFSIRDTGIGIPAGKRDCLFQKFTQADSSTTRRYGGTGLGLAISKQIVELMGGEIGVESPSMSLRTGEGGPGSEFWFTACFAKQTGEGGRNVMPLTDICGTHILVVDDNATNREVLKAQLRSWGVRSEEVPDGPSALRELHRALNAGDPFRAAILDMQMPDMDGITLACSIKADAKLKDIYMVLLTSMGQLGDARKIAEIGFSACLSKPVRSSDLFDSLAAVLAGQKMRLAAPLFTRQAILEINRGMTVRILLAEDNIVNQMVAVGILKKLGLRADAVANGAEAVDALKTIPYDLVLMDVQMPVMDGLEATRRIRNPHSAVLNHQIPIIAMTAGVMQEDRDRCLNAGMNDYVTKPVSPQALAEALEEWLPKPE